MMNNNKILTVSYGTFSCTLEGFDDSFGTMKAIAEYFRDLASDDRYFGAEPPQPDAEMLQRIAQKEISRRVEAREHEGKIVLSALAGASALDVPHPSAPETESTLAAPVTADVLAAAALAEDTPEPTPETDESALDASSNAPAVAEAQAEEAVVETEQPLEQVAEDVPAQEAVEAEAVDPVEVTEDIADAIADAAIAPEDENDIVPGQPDAEVEAFFENSDGPTEVFEEDALEAPASEAHPSPNSIAAKLQRIRAVVAQQDDTDENDAYSEDEHALVADDLGDLEDVIETQDLADDAAQSVEEDIADEDASQDDTAEHVMADALRDIEDALEADEALENADDLEEASDIAATLRHIEAHGDALEDDGADAAVSDEEVDDVAQMLAQMSLEEDEPATGEEMSDDASLEDDAPLAEDDIAEDAIDEVAEADDNFDDAVAEENADADDVNAPFQLTAAQELRVEPEETGAASHPRARVIKVKRSDLNAAIARGDLEEYEDESAEEDAPMSLDDMAPAKTETSSLSPEEEDDLARELAALEADILSEQSSEIEAEDQPEAEQDDQDVSLDALLNDLADEDDEASASTEDSDDRADAIADDFAEELTAELAEGSRDDVAEDDSETVAELAEDARADLTEGEAEEDLDTHAARDKLPSLDDQSDNMERLMSEADHQMGEPESATRRDAFAHLRAAVAAKKADDSLGSDNAAEDNAYRNDLADVVRPRRPVSRPANPSERTKRPGEGRPAPLKLVAEQRIDVEREAPTGPVRPRRVASVLDTPEVDGAESFSEFASEMGATTLPDLLEAAAAYMSFVEGREQFSRPQLMTKVRQAGPQDGFSREDTLRSFGQLLRDGKIEKIKGGRFMAAEDIGFRPDQREAS